ncbi:prenyltransferase [Schumannella sp. 10F1B-5-1]|uniref:prenyltransferase n=1 Tax=Schumannella sp. 10F1B-5-1 TaxID=2590780 RepID=UPI0011320CAB|nr:prenyltransferase [Schumannella sp. 10F1B-5-1]TPW76849.1 prenyltransferase [Schumannella sp. 10F1B-5-1]
MIRALLLSSRPLSWVNTAFPFAAAYILSITGGADRGADTASGWDARTIALAVIGTLFFLVPYNLTMYGINDVFDYESDLRNPRKGGVEGALLDKRMHRATIAASTALPGPFVVALLVIGGLDAWPSWIVLVISLFAVVAYSAPGMRFKERPLLDSITSSTHFVSPAVYGFALAGAQFDGRLVALLAAFFLWGMASHAFGAVQDIEADREGGIGSVATVIGAKATVRASLVAYLFGGALLLATDWPGPLAALLVLPYAANVAPWWNVADADAAGANRGWRRFLWLNFVTGFLVTMLLIWYAVIRTPIAPCSC